MSKHATIIDWLSIVPDTIPSHREIAQVGMDPEKFPSTIKDHPCIGKRFMFRQVKCTITRCVIHPRGRIMLDVESAPDEHQHLYERMYQSELRNILKG